MERFEKLVLSSPGWAWLSRRLLRPWVLSFADLPGDGEVLVIGCGGGAEVQGLAARFPRWYVTATDYDPEMVATARSRLASLESRVRVEQADAGDLPYEDASFDAVVAILVWHHVGVWEKATAEAARVLRPQGRLVLADLLRPSFSARGPAVPTTRDL